MNSLRGTLGYGSWGIKLFKKPRRLSWLIVLGRFKNSNVLVTDYRCLLN